MTAPVLEVRSVTARFGPTVALSNVSLTVAAGTRHAILGPNGAGKTTLLNVIAGTLRPSAGRILLDGRDITRLPPHRRSRLGIARTWQHPALCHRLTALENVLLACRSIRPGQHRHGALDSLESAGLAEHADTPAGQLSYGQQRRLELAVALTARPRLVLLDEPSAGLSHDDTARLLRRLLALDRQVTAIIIEQDLSFVEEFADSITVFEQGHVIEVSAPEPLSPAATTPAAARSPSDPGPAAPVLAVRALMAGYGTAPVINGLDLDLGAGQVIAITGRNGSGKSTLLNAIAGLHPTAPGTRIVLKGQNVTRLSAAQRRRIGIALLPQQQHIFPDLTVEENLRLSLHRNGDTSAALDEALKTFPEVRSMLRRPAGQLSGGQQQALAMIRTLLTQPAVLLLDEPFEGLAPKIAETFENCIRRSATQGTAIVLIDHELRRLQALADLVALVDAGHLRV